MRIARRSADPFLRLLTATTTIWVLGQAFINIGYVIGMLPVTGMQLPLISAGGTSTATTLFMIGIMANAARHEPEAVAALRAGRDDKVNRVLRLPLPEPYVPSRIEAFRDRKRPARSRPRPPAATAAEGAQAPARKAPQRRIDPAAGVTPNSRPAGPAGQGIMDLASGAAGRPASYRARLAHWKVSVTGERHDQAAGRRAGGSALARRCRVIGQIASALSVVLAGGGTAGHVEPAMAVADALTALDPAGPDHRAGHRARAGDPAGARARLPPRADHARCRCRASPTATWPGCHRGCGVPCGRPGRCSTPSTPTSWSVSAGTWRCRPTSPPADPRRAGGVSRW